MNTRLLTLVILLGSVWGLKAQTASSAESSNHYLWPIEGARAGEGILYRPQDYIDKEHVFEKLFIGAEQGSNVVCPCDGTVAFFNLVYQRSLTSSGMFNGKYNSFDEAIERHKESMNEMGLDERFLSYGIHIKSEDGKTVYISGLNTDKPVD